MIDLTTQLNALCDAHPFHTGWCLKDLRTGATADRHGHTVVPSASTRKIAILMAALKAVHEGTLSLEQPVAITAEYQVSNSGVFQHFRPGFTIALHDVLVMMIVVSDNACTGTIADMLGLDAINALCRSIGMAGTTHRETIPRSTLRVQPAPAAGQEQPPTGVPSGGSRLNETTPADVGLLLDLMLRGSGDPAAAAQLGCTPELCRLALDILSWQKLNTRLPLLLPVGAKVAHKTGTGGHCYNDAGIVYRNGGPRFILTVYTNKVPKQLPDGSSASGATSLLIGRLARACWDAMP
ncbi:MAG: Beta-lactamase [uncultured Chloroflexi bacterium]|uniref:Beta-lactamase n=1 Tax=uncultured Chloroflexota bacterium TaxID=166587 RepID=A0A6J4J4N3_9CHLR|nr:MAG: Beta-lactamase [uncultured Chloroflexota bacterium]